MNSNLNDVNINAKNENEHESSDSLMKDIRFTLLIIKKKKSKIFKATKRRQVKSKAKRAIQMNSNSDEIQFKSIQSDDKNKSMTNAMIEMQHISFIDFKFQFETEQMTNQKKFEIELIQRSQHHEKIMIKTNETILVAKMQHEETMMRLKIELKKRLKNRNKNEKLFK
jgi:hypothetical protein